MTPAVEDDHPTWCDAKYCESLAGGLAHHRGAPFSWRSDGGDAEITVFRSQIDMHQTPDPTYHIHICRFDVDEEVSIEWTRGDMEQLARVLEHLARWN